MLVGDAAGFYDPFTGEGVTLALRGAELAAEVADRAARDTATTDLRATTGCASDATRDKFRLNRLLQRVVAWPALANAVARRLARRPDLADRLVGIAGDFVPARTALGPGFLYEMLKVGNGDRSTRLAIGGCGQVGLSPTNASTAIGAGRRRAPPGGQS